MIPIPFLRLLSPWTLGSVEQMEGMGLDWVIHTFVVKPWQNNVSPPLQGHLHFNGQCPDPEFEREALGGAEYAISRGIAQLRGCDRRRLKSHVGVG